MAGETSQKTVLIVQAGCGVGADLAVAFSAAGARVIVVDHAERRTLALARHAPHRIESLTLDSLRPGQCRLLGRIWADEPLDILVHLHALRSPRRLGAAVAAIPALTRALLPGLARGEGQVIAACRAPRPDAQSEDHAFDAALLALAPLMQKEVGGRACVTLLRLGPQTGREAPVQAALRLGLGAGNASRGAVLDLAGEGATARSTDD